MFAIFKNLNTCYYVDMSKIKNNLKVYLSHRPRIYALIVGIGVVLFWRGVWHSVDLIHFYIDILQNDLSNYESIPWWDGPLSLIFGIFILNLTSAFTSSFIGNELILSGLRGEERLTKETEKEVKSEENVILEIREELISVTGKIAELEKEMHNKKHNK